MQKYAKKGKFCKMIRIEFVLPLMLCMLMFMTCSHANSLSGGSMTFKIQSSAFNEGDLIPSKYTCEEKDIFPPLSWKDAPDNTKSFVLIVDDPDAPGGNWDHCIVFNMPETTHQLAENMTSLPKNAEYGKNSWGNLTYGGPCPPSGTHRYYFKLYALDSLLNISAGASKKQIETAMQGHVLAETQLMGRYKKLK